VHLPVTPAEFIGSCDKFLEGGNYRIVYGKHYLPLNMTAAIPPGTAGTPSDMQAANGNVVTETIAIKNEQAHYGLLVFLLVTSCI
jgi:hypothetical protein